MEKKEMQKKLEEIVPMKTWFTLKEACAIKSLGYKNLCHKKYLRPNGGVPDGIIGGKMMWLRSTVIDWILMTDEEILHGGDNDAR